MIDSASEPLLKGLRVIEFGQLIAVPLTGLILSDLGADVVKVEPPGGDPGRALRSAHVRNDVDSPTFKAYSRGKRSVVLDLKDDNGRRQARRLIETADIVIENSRPGVMDRLGLGADRLCTEQPELIYASIAGFGFSGPDHTRPGVDIVLQAESGIMAMTGHPGGPPTRVGFTLVDAVAGNVLAQAILAALLRRSRTNSGDRIEVSLFDVALHLQVAPMGEYLTTGQLPVRVGNSAPMTSPADLLPTKDGFIVISAYFADQWRTLCNLLNLPEFVDDSRFATREARVANREALLEGLGAVLMTDTSAHWGELLVGAGLVVGQVRDYEDLSHSEQVSANGMWKQVGEADRAFTTMRLPFRLGAEPEANRRPAPLLGEHTREVLAELDGD